MNENMNLGKAEFYYLKNCDSCTQILKQLPADKLLLINVKECPLTKQQLEKLKKLAGSFEALFNFRAQKLRELDLQDKPTTEADFEKYLLAHYTFLKRPVAVVGNEIFIGNMGNNMVALQSRLWNKR